MYVLCKFPKCRAFSCKKKKKSDSNSRIVLTFCLVCTQSSSKNQFVDSEEFSKYVFPGENLSSKILNKNMSSH